MNNQGTDKFFKIKIFLNDYFYRNNIKFEKKFRLPANVYVKKEKEKIYWFIQRSIENAVKPTFTSNSDIKMKQIKAENCLKTLQGHTNNVSCVCFNTAQDELISGSVDKTVKIWSIRSGICLKTLQGHTGLILCLLVLTKHLVISGSGDRTIKIWDTRNEKCILTLRGHLDWVNSEFSLIYLDYGKFPKTRF
jgi:WD40 repeat protein